MPEKIGKYEIKSSLGEGGMGVVYEGFDPIIERRVAIKLLHPNMLCGNNRDEMLERFRREALSAARCVHPNIVTVLDYDVEEDTPFIVMEFVEGLSLQRIISRKRSISLKSTLTIIMQLLRALQSAHRLGIVHRDIKADNVLIMKDGGRVKLSDFGVASIAQSPDMTMIGSVVGTPRYMAPEQAFGLETDSRADLFSTARLLLELLTRLPKDTSVPCSRLPRIERLPSNNRIDYSIVYPTALIPVLTRGLSVDPNKRFQNAAQFMQAIKKMLPRLRRESAAAADNMTSAIQQSTQNFPASSDELKSLTSLLASYVGPIAQVIMDGQDTSGTSSNDLLTEISKDIPEPQRRMEFLEQWTQISGNTRPAQRTQASDKHGNQPDSSCFDETILNQVGRDLAHYVGPFAFSLLEEKINDAASFEQLVTSLALEIPNADRRKDFITAWLQE